MSARYARFVLLLAGVTVLLLAIGFLPTRALAGEGSWPSMLAGCLVSFVASALGGIPLGLGRGSGAGAPGLQLALMSMALRLALVVAGGILVVSVPGVEVPVALVWVGISYLALLVPDTRFGLTALRTL